MLRDSEQYRLQAQRTEELAQRVPFAVERDEMLKIAQQWRALEASAKRRERILQPKNLGADVQGVGADLFRP